MIPVSEKLPDADILVIGYNQEKDRYYMCHRSMDEGDGEEYWFEDGSEDFIELTHWQHLPHPADTSHFQQTALRAHNEWRNWADNRGEPASDGFFAAMESLISAALQPAGERQLLVDEELSELRDDYNHSLSNNDSALTTLAEFAAPYIQALETKIQSMGGKS